MKQLLQVVLIAIYIIAFLIPGYTYFFVSSDATKTLFSSTADIQIKLFTIFRLFGLYAFTFVWSQIMLGTFRLPLTKLFGAKILKLHMTFGIFTLLFAFLHPLLFYAASLMTDSKTPLLMILPNYLGPQGILYGYFGVIALSIMLVTVTTAKLRLNPFFMRWWRYVHYANYLIFILVFLHSWRIGSDVHQDPLQGLYLFFGVSFVVGLSYRRVFPVVKSFMAKRNDSAPSQTTLQ